METLPKPLVSVLLPVLNAEPAYLELAVRSILAQTFQEIELILVEDPSARPARSLISALGDPRIQYVANLERTSLVRQLNQGLLLARADLVARMDADDIAAPDRLEKQVEFLRDHPEIDVVGSWIEGINEKGERIGYRCYPVSPRQVREAVRRINPVAHPSVMYRRETILNIGGYQDSYPVVEDYDLWSRLLTAGCQIANLPIPLLRYRLHAQGLKSTKLRGIMSGTLAIKRRYWWQEMRCWEKWRCRGEQLLTFCPSWLVMKVFVAMTFQKTLPDV
jgi:glycosyltransferase involved in cell wall biosynthesis